MRNRVITRAGGFLLRVDDLLRGRDLPVAQRMVPSVLRLVLITCVFGVAYGATMGTFGGLAHDRWVQVLYAGIKVPMLLLVSFCIALPSFFVINTVAGLRSDSAEVVHALISTQAGLTVVLASLGPLTAFWYVSCPDYNAALLFNGGMFAIATAAAQWIIRRSYRRLIARNPRHLLLLRSWLLLYSFVAIQMPWVLRPFVGDPSQRPSFFRHEAWGNAYVEIAHLLLHALR